MSAYNYYMVDSQSRHYHNWQHATRVVEACRTLADVEGLTASDSLLLAALWHDAIYFPGARPGVNENASAAALTHNYHLEIVKCWIPELHHATRLIENTTIDNHMSTDNKDIPELDILLDADLSSLADSYTDFEINQYNIIRENHMNPEIKQSRMRSCNFLECLMNSRKSIFRTDKAIGLYEAKAVSNITRFIKENR